MNLAPDIHPEQSIELLKELHLLTVDGKLNQDSRRKLKQIYHLSQFIEPMIKNLVKESSAVKIVDHGAGKSYLGFILYDLFLKNLDQAFVYGVESREELVEKSLKLSKKLGFERMKFVNQTIQTSNSNQELPAEVDIVTALHACDIATDDAIDFALKKKAKFVVLIPCCQAEIASLLKKNKNVMMGKTPHAEIWKHAHHSREFGSHLTNVLRCLKLESQGYQVTVTEFTGWEHSLKNELILAELKNSRSPKVDQKIEFLLEDYGLTDLKHRFLS